MNDEIRASFGVPGISDKDVFMLIECLVERDGPSYLHLNGFRYVFRKNEFGHSVTAVNSREHRQYLLKLSTFREYRPWFDYQPPIVRVPYRGPSLKTMIRQPLRACDDVPVKVVETPKTAKRSTKGVTHGNRSTTRGRGRPRSR